MLGPTVEVDSFKLGDTLSFEKCYILCYINVTVNFLHLFYNTLVF